MKNIIKIAVAGLVTTAFVSPAFSGEKNLAAVENAITRTIATQQLTGNSPLEKFALEVKQIQEPKAAPLLDALQELTAYNQTFETEKDVATLRSLAAKLEGPVAVPWNTYRGNGLKEIFDKYIPNSHKNKQVAKLEYYVKLYTLSEDTHVQTYVVSKALPANFVQSYTKLKDTLAAQPQQDGKEFIKAIVHFVPAYNKLAQQDPVAAKQLKKTLFAMPIQTGWDRTFSLRELVFQVGMDEFTLGYSFKTIEQIQRQTGASIEDIKVFDSFVHAIR